MPQQTHSVRAGGDGGPCLFRQRDVGLHENGHAVARHGRAGGPARRRGGLAGAFLPASERGRHDVVRRAHRDRTGVAVDDQGRAVGDGEERRTGADHHRQAESACQDDAVGGRPARRARDAGHGAEGERGDVGGGELVGDDHRRLLRRPRGRLAGAGLPPARRCCARGVGPQVAQHLVAHLADVGGTRSLVGVGQSVPRGGRLRYRRGPRGAGRLLAREHSVPDRTQESRVLQEELVGVEDRRGGLVAAGHGGARVAQIRRGGDQCGLEGGPLRRRVAGGSIGERRPGVTQS